MPLGYAVWALYVAPIALTFFAPRAQIPLLAAAAATVLLIVGYFLSPPEIVPDIAALNRVFGGTASWILAAAGFLFIQNRARLQRTNWLQEVSAEIAHQLLGEKTTTEAATDALRVLAHRLQAGVATVYLADHGRLLRVGSWGVRQPEQLPDRLEAGEGLVGQVFNDGRAVALREIGTGYLRVESSLGGQPPRALVVAPILAEGRPSGAVELGLTDPTLADEALALLEEVAASLGMALRSAQYRERLNELLEETQRQSETLQAQQEELRASNEELEEQGQMLRESQARLEEQQAELEQTNAQLEEQTHRLERQKEELLVAQAAMERSTDEVRRASRYKSEFLANMSHELRTPLNSSMILSRLLSENRTGNLTAEQIRYAQIILSANNDLLNLINDILDLSKIESGHLQLELQPVAVAQVLEPVREAFAPMAEQRGLALRFEVVPGAPSAIVTDPMRLQQVLKNLLSNALKFTAQGEVVLTVHNGETDRIVFDVRDTGIGIPREQQQVIFEAFRQADGTTSRKYGGTGLGLSICRELVALLGGTIEVQSEPGHGSTFSVRLPVRSIARAVPPLERAAPERPSVQREPVPAATPDSAPRPAPAPGAPHRSILVVEDDPGFAEILCGLVEELGFECLVARTAQDGLDLARQRAPSAILLDMGLPDHSGLAVLETLKREAGTRHIPVHVVSVADHTQTALQLGAIGYMLKPTAREELVEAIGRLERRLEKRVQRVLLVEDDHGQRESVVALLSTEGVVIEPVGTVAAALQQLQGTTYDCVVLDLALPDGSGYDVLERMSEGGPYAFPPVIVYTGRALTRDEEQRLRRYSKSIILKGARSPARLLDEVTLFLHKVESELPPERRRLLMEARQRDAVLEGRTILLVEDDVRNVYSLTRVLEPLGCRVEVARNGLEALRSVDGRDAVDLVLMDIMMPEMDGLTATREIRKRPGLASLPIIALTANAMPEDRVRCLQAGASDYIAKPIDVDKLISLCRVWMPK